ncbi:ATP-binding protein [Nostoc sp. FACHB-190]|uniref:ATP-binding protein n=1 Tax=Nostoc sp. FACHB-190 TaxID=2692838 RepID=UPI001687A0E2|nr:ATP-binding protein [Nostoc sp. FACHB-190]MBD2298869.1 AAA family ATPase [Nostoc sp. FACHB-190]
MKKRKIIFVGGVHGVGKTTFCNEILSNFNIKYFSASHLISLEKEEKDFHNKQVGNIPGNQDILLTAIDKYLRNDDWYLLDGHFCLLNKNNEITPIPYSTYKGICPSAILVLVDHPENIYNKLIARDSIKYELTLLESFQKQEIAYAEYIKDNLNIPYLMCNTTEVQDTIFSFIEGLLL